MKPILLLLVLLNILFADVIGIIIAPDGTPVAGATVSLLRAGLTTISNENGQFVLGEGLSVTETNTSLNSTPQLNISATSATITLHEPATIQTDLFSLSGRKVATLFDGRYASGTHAIPVSCETLGTQLFILRCNINGQSFSQKLLPYALHTATTQIVTAPNRSIRTSDADTLAIQADGFGSTRLTVNSNDTLTVQLFSSKSLSSGEPFQQKLLTKRYSGSGPYFMIDAPEGMTVLEKTGLITWFPTSNQTRIDTALISLGDGLSQEIIFTVTTGKSDPSGIYVAPSGTDADGYGYSPDKPFATVKYASKKALPGDTVFVRGGLYKNDRYGDRTSTGSVFDIDGPGGESGNPIVYRPLGNEQVKILFDGNHGISVDAPYHVIDGFEIRGIGDSLTSEQVVSQWWESTISMGHCITVRSHHVEIKNCIAHHAPAKGVNGYGADFLNVHDNIIYNNCWWNPGGTSGITLIRVPEPLPGTTDSTWRAVFSNNLLFGNEQLMFSRVWSKGFANLTVDEGGAILIQLDDSTVVGPGRYQADNNLILFNSKSGSLNRSWNVSYFNNTLYGNGTVLSSKNGGFRASTIENCHIYNNISQVFDDQRAISTGTEITCSWENNYVVWPEIGNFTHEGVIPVSSILTDPENGDFTSSVDGIGISPDVLNSLMAKCGEYGISVKRTGNNPDLPQVTRGIIDNVPAGCTVDESGWPDSVVVSFPDGSTHPAAPKFTLLLHYLYK